MPVAEPTEGLREWSCECGNILGIMHRDSNRIMVLDQFRNAVKSGQVEIIVSMAVPANYAVKNLVRGDVICPSCGRSRPWDANEFLIRRLMKRLGLEEQYMQAKGKAGGGGS